MIVRKTYLPEKENYNPYKKILKNHKKKANGNFQKELFDFIQKSENIENFYQERENKIELESELKRYFLGTIVRKDHLFSGNLSEIQKENIIMISQNYY